MTEEWRSISGFTLYKVSNFGLVKRGSNILGSICRRDGYVKITLSEGSKRISTSVHRLVADAFIPNPENKPCVNHKNCIRNDNRVENLEWCTYSENNNYGDTQERHSKSIMGHPKFLGAGNPCKLVTQLTKVGHFIRSYPSIQEASRVTGVNYRHIGECCNLRRNTAGGYVWRFVFDYSLYASLL